MKNWMENNLGRRLISLALALCMVLSVLPPVAHADDDPADNPAAVTADTTEGDPSGGAEGEPTSNGGTEGDPASNGSAEGDPASNGGSEGGETEKTQVCTCENRCFEVDATNSCQLCAVSIDNCTGAPSCEHGLTADCRLCAVRDMLAALPEAPEGADREQLSQQLSQLEQALALLTGEETASFDLTRYQALAAYLASLPQVVTAWSWIEKDEEAPVLAEESGAMVVSFATAENPLYLWSVQNVLPEKLSATVNGEAVELTLGSWSCGDYPASGAYQGTYTFTTTLPQGYVLGEDVAALEIPVIFMDGTSQWNGTESTVSYIGSDNTPGTCETYTAVTDAEAETWSDGWYVVSGDVTIKSLTITGGASLILKNGSSLKVNNLTVSGGALTVYGQEKKSGTLTIKGGMELLTAPITIISGAVCAEITLDEVVANSDNITIPNGMSVELNLKGSNINFSSGCGFELGTESKLALWNEVYGVSFPNGIKANVPLKNIVKDGYAFFDYNSGYFITTIYSTPETRELSEKLYVYYHRHTWEYAQVENYEQHHKATCTKCLTELRQEHNTDDLTIEYVDETSHQLVCRCGKVLGTESHELKTSYYSGTQHRVSCDGNCGYVEQFSDHVYDEETGVCACGAEKTSYLGTDGAIHTVGCLDFCVESRLHEGNYFQAEYKDQIWYVARGTDTVPGITLLGKPSYNLILADGCDVSVTDSVNCPAMTIWGQENGTGTLTVTDANNTAIYATSSLTINGGTVVASGAKAFSALPAMAQGMMAYVVDGEAETPVLRASAADSFGNAQKMRVTRCNQSHDGSGEVAYEYVNESTHRPVCPYCAVSLPGENQPHSFTDGSCACGAVEENGQGVLITTLSGTYSGVTLTGTYLVTGQTTFTDRAEVAGSAKLILADGCTLTAEVGIHVAVDNTLEIVGQAGHTGRLVTTADSQADAPIGGNAEEVSGAITIDGCSVEAEGATDSGIGVSMNSAPGSVTIRNAEVITTKLPEDASITNSIIRMSGNATVYGNATLRSTLNVFDEKSLTVPEGASLTVPQNVSVNISGSLQGSGTIYLLSNDFNANTNNSTVRIWCLLELEDCTVSGEGVLIAHQGKYFCEAGKEITLTPSEGTQADSWKVSYSVTKEVGDEEWETVVTTNYYPGSFTMPAHPVSVKPHIHTFESGVCKGCGAVDAKYRDENGTEQTPPQCTILTAEMNSPAAGWYLVTGTLEFNEEFWIGGDVKLILADGAVLNANGGITMVDTDSKLTVYGQKEGTGVLNISNSFQGTLTATQDVIVRVAENATGTVSGSCVLFKGSLGTVRGAVERTSVPMGADESLLVPEGSTLTLGSTTFTGPVCLKISAAPAFFASSLRQSVAAAALTGENAEVYYPLEYTDTNIILSGLYETNSFTRSDVKGYLVKAGTKVTVSYNEPFGKLFNSFNVELDADSSFTMPQSSVSIEPSVQNAALAVKYGESSYKNYVAGSVQDAFRFAMEQANATVVLFGLVISETPIELTGGSITLTSPGETRGIIDGKIDLKGGNLTIQNVDIVGMLSVYTGKLNATSGYIDDLRVESKDLSDVVISGGEFGYINVSDNRSIFFILEEGKALKSASGMADLSSNSLTNVKVVDHIHSWTIDNNMTKPENHTQTCSSCSTKVTVPHKAAGADGKCGCGLYVVSYVDHRGEKKGTKGCRPVSGRGNLNDGWYVVKGTVHFDRTTINGNVNLILTPGSEYKGQEFHIETNSTLTVWSQSTGWTKEAAGLLSGDHILSGGKLVLNGGCVQMESLDHGTYDCEVQANGGYLKTNSGTGDGNSIRGSFSTASDGCALIDVITDIADRSNQASWSGIFYFRNQSYVSEDDHKIFVVYGNQTLNQSIPEAVGLHVPKGAALTYESGLSCPVYVDGTFTREYSNAYYRLTYPEGTINAPEDAKATFTVNRKVGTYYKKGTKITLGEGTWLLNNELVKGTFFTMPAQASVLERGAEINYYDENGAPQTTYGKPFPDGDKITLSDNGSAPAWFLLSKDQTLNERLEIEGEVNLVVDAATGKLTAKQGIHVGPNAKLRLYLSTATKADGFGLVKASIVKSTKDSINDAVIGGNQNEASGSIFFNGPDVNVIAFAIHDQGAVSGAGIGGGMKGSAGPIVVNRGSIGVTVSGYFGVYGAGIGGGSGASNTSFTINGGHVGVNMTALSRDHDGIVAAGIGGGQGTENVSNGGVLDFRGGSVNVTLNGKSTAAGIGGGAYGNAGTITVSGKANVTSTIDARDSTNETQGAAIGSGCEGKGGSVTISGGTVIATITNGTSHGAAIGNGYYYSQPVDITITNGTVNATIDQSTTANGAAIGGGGGFAVPGKILITGGTVTAKNESPDSHTAAIGGGYGKDCSYIAITGGTVNATAPYNAIGGGRFDSGSVIGKGGTFIQLTKDVTFDNSKATSVSANGIAYIKIDDNTGYFRVYGEVTLDRSIVIPTGTNLLVPEGTKLNLNGATNNGAIFVDGTLVGGGDSIYYRINFDAETTRASASSDTENAVKTFQGGTYALSGKVIQLNGSYDVWYLKYLDEKKLEGGTFTMPASTVTIKGHHHSISYSNQTQNGHTESCVECGYQKKSAAHVFTDGKCPCGCLQTTYVGLDGSDVTVVGLPVPDDGKMTGDSGTGGWYILRGERQLTPVIMEVSGNVNLVLEDGATVITNRNMGITLPESASLTIWGQAGNTGSLNIKEGIEGLGTNSLTINGGTVTVPGGAPSIKFPVTVNGGKLTMTNLGTSIQSSLTVTGGEATVTSTSGNAIVGNVTVSGGEATVTSTSDNAIEGNVTVSGGKATVTSDSGNAIEGNVTVSGGVAAVTSKSGYAIQGNVTVSGGKLTAKSEASKDLNRFAIYNANMTDGKVEVMGKGQLFAQSNYVAIYSAHVLVSGGTLEATGVANAINAKTMVVTNGNVTAKTTNTACTGIDTSNGLTVKGGTVNAVSVEGTAIRGSITLEGGKVEAKGYFGIIADGGTVDVKGGELMAEGTNAEAIKASKVNVSGTGIVTAQSAIFSNVNVSGGSLTAKSTTGHGIYGNAIVSGGTVKLSTPEEYGISGQLTITGGWVEANSVGWVIANGNGNGILITKEIKDLNSSQLLSGLIQLGTAPAKVYGAPVFNQNLTIGKTETIQNIHIPENASLTMTEGNTLTNNGHIYLDVGGSLDTEPAAASTGKVYYQVKLGEGVEMPTGDVVSVGSSSYAIGNVTFSRSNDGYLVTEGGFTDVVTDSWNVTQPITVSGHTHSWSYFGITQSKHNAICQDVTGFIHEVTDEAHSGDPCVCGAGYYGYLLADNTQAPEKKYCLPVTADTTALTTGWYVALEGKLTGKASITVSGDVNLILAEDADYYPGAITLTEGATLTIWGQNKVQSVIPGEEVGCVHGISVSGSGSVIVNGGYVKEVQSFNVPLTVNNGKVHAFTGNNPETIFTQPITINGGKVEVYCQSWNPKAPVSANTTVNGGTLAVVSHGSEPGTVIKGDLIANGGAVDVKGKITGTLKSTKENAGAWVTVSQKPTIDSNWSGLLCVGEGDIVVYGTPQLREAFNIVRNIYIPAGTKLTTGGNLTTSSNLYVAGTLEGDVTLLGVGEIRYAITGDEDTIRHAYEELNYQGGKFAKDGWHILLGEEGKDLGIDGWMINGQFKRYYANQELTFTMPAQPTVVMQHKHDFDADGNCVCGLVQVTYRDGTEKKTVLCMPFTEGTTELSRGVTDGWYAITKNFESTQTVSSIEDYLTYNLVLADGCSATITGSISTQKNNLKVWGQEGGTGKLTVKSSTATPALEVTDGYSLDIEGGQLELTNNDGTALKGRVYANGGSLTATSQSGSAIQGLVAADGGSLTATSQTGYAIDGSVSGDGCVLVAKSEKGTAVSGLVNIWGGTATLTGKTQAVGENLIVSGGDVTVSSNSAGSATVNGLAGLNNGNISIRNLGGGAAIGGSLNTEDAVVYLQGGIGDNSTNIFWNSLICQYPSTIYQAYGSAHLMQGASFPEEPSAIYIPTGAYLHTNGNLNVSCPIYVSGTLAGTNSGSGPIYYPLTLPEGATAQAGEGGTAKFEGMLFARKGETITLEGEYDCWKVYEDWLMDENDDFTNTFEMKDKTTVVEGHLHDLVYYDQDQYEHYVRCGDEDCPNNPGGSEEHKPDENGHCACGMILVEYKKPDGTKDSKYCFPFSHDTLAESTKLSDEWYVLTENVGGYSYGYYNIAVNGNVNLILADGSYLNLYANLSMEKGSSLTIWEQEQGTGRLFISYMPAVPGAVTPPDGTPGVGGAAGGGKLIINGGLLNVTTMGWDRACIGCDVEINGGVLSLNNMDHSCIEGNVVQKGGELTVTGNRSSVALAGSLTVYKGVTTVTGNGVGVKGDVRIYDGTVSFETGSYAVQGNAAIFGGTVALVREDRKSDAISGTLDTGYGSTAVIVCSGNIGTPYSGLICSGDLSNRKYEYQLYGTFFLDHELKFPAGFYPAVIYIPSGVWMSSGPEGNSYLNVSCPIYVSWSSGLMGTNSGSGKVYYQVVKENGADVAAAQGGEVTTFREGTYAYGSVTFSGGTDGYFVRDVFTDYGSLGEYQSGSGYTVTQPITVIAHTHAFDDKGNCTCTVRATVKVTMGGAESYYGSLAEALGAIGDGEATITLLGDTTGDITISQGNLTIQGDKRITAILVTGGSLEITGGDIAALEVQGGTVNLSGGTFDKLNVQGGTVKLSGGTFGTISSSGGVVELLEEDFAFRLEDGSWLDRFNGTDTNALSGGTVCPVPLKNAQLTGPSSITCGDNEELTFSVTESTRSRSAVALSWNRDGEDLSVTGSTCGLSDWDVSRGADNAVQFYRVSCTATLEGYCLTAARNITINPKTLTISWSNTRFTYDGQPHNPTASSNVSGISLILSQAQTNAGTHSAQVTGIQGTKAGNYQLPAAVTMSFTIDPAAITGVTLKADSAVYTGEAQTPAIQAVKAGELTLSSGDYELSFSSETIQNAGTYQVTISGKGNFTGSIEKNYTITKAASSVDTAPTAKTLTYNGKAQALVSAGTANGGTLVYSLDGSSYSEKIPAITEAGTYTVWYKVQGDGNHTDTEAQKLTVSIARKDISQAAINLGAGLVYNGKEQTQTITSVTVDGLSVTYDVSGNTATEKGTYTLTVTGTGSFTGKATAQFKIAAAAAAVVTAPTAKILTYNGQAQALVSAGTANGGTLVYSLDGRSYSEKMPTGTDAKAYTVWYKVQGDSNHNDTEAEKLTVSIAQKDISDAIITLGAGLIYNGKEQTQTITSVTVDGLPVTYEVTGNTGTEKGIYTLTVTGTGSFTGTATAQFKIAAGADAVVTAPTAKTLTYNGQAQALVSPGTANGGTLVYSLDGRSYSEKVPTGTAAGTYTVWYKVQGDSNHSDTEVEAVTVTIARKDISKAVITLGADLTYNGKEQTQTITSVTVDGLSVTYDVTGNTATNAGSYTLTVTGKGSFTGKATANFTIAKAQPSVAPAELTITYGTKLSGCDLSGFAASFQGTKLPGSFAFDEPDVMPRVADSGSTGYQLTFTPEDLVNFHTASMEARLTVSAKELTVDAAVQDKQYDSTNKASFVSGRPALVGLVDGDVVELSHGEPYFKTVEVGTGIEIRFTDVFAISGKDSANYYLTQPAGITASIYISFKAECGKEYTVNADGWQSTDFVAAASEGYSLSGSNSTKGPWFDKLTVTQEGTGELSFYVRNNTTGAISELVKEGYRIDKSMPTGTIRFDGADETESSPRACYKKQDVAVTITGSDTLSGVASISCFLADSEKTEAELKAITQWMEKTSFTIPAVDGTRCFLYAKIVDNAGNAAYFRANRIIFDTSVPSISGVESGKVYYTTQTVTVSDANLKSVLLSGKSVESPVTLKGDVNETYELLITDQAGNEITITVTMKAISSITDPVKSITGETVTEDDRKQLEDAADTLKGLVGTATDGDEKQKLQDELDKLEELLKLLDQVKNVETMLDALPDSVTPDADKETEQDIKDARKAFDQLSEHQQSLVDERLKEKLERLEGELVDYQFESGADTVWNRSSGMNLQFVANGRLDKLDKVLVDGKELSADDFTKSSPKTTTELQAAFLGTLEQGKHTLELVYSDGKVEAGFTVMSGTDYLELTDKPVFDGLTEVEVDGISYPIQELDGKRYVMLPETGDLLTIYTYRNGTSGNTHDNYPTGMRVFRINRSENGNTITELPELADLLIYSGCSIRINGNRGVRMITSMAQSNKEALTGDGLAGFTMLESGTVVQWADSFTGSLNLDSGKHNYAYKRGTADPVFATSGGLTQYTNVLVGFDLDQCSKDIVMRPYVIVEDADGKQYTLYGGRVTRSISYIAWQNRDTYQPGTAAYDYVHELMGNITAG